MPKSEQVNIATLVISAFDGLFHSIMRHEYSEYWLKGGRGSTKSSFISIVIVLLVVTFPFANAIVLRRYGNTLRDSVYNQVLWTINEMHLNGFFKASVSPMEITYLPTGQKIVFRGMDDPLKLKSVKFTTGYAAIHWFEELDQFSGWDAVGSALKSFRRGGDKFWTFYSYNPPRTMWCWVNQKALEMETKPTCLVSHSTYLDVVDSGHADWLGEPFIEEAEWQRDTNELQYRWEMMGEVIGNGDNVFDQLEIREITDDEIATFDHPLVGQDFGWYPDPWATTISEWRPNTRTLLTWREDGGNKLQPPQQAERLKQLLTWKDDRNDARAVYHHLTVQSDDAAPEIIASQRDSGINARAAGKANLRDASYRFLQSLTWVIDPKRCPRTAEEAANQQYEKNKDGEVINNIPDGNDHWIDATRYAVMPVVRRFRQAYR